MINKLFVLIIFYSLISCGTRFKDGTKINVKTYGAKGNDRLDDTKAFQDALDYISSVGGGELYVPQGTYYVRRTEVAGKAYCIKIPSNCKIIGDDMNKSVIKLMAKQTNYTRIAYFEKNTNLVLSNLTFDGNASAQVKTKGAYNEHLGGLFVSQSSDILISDCKFINTGGDGVSLRGSIPTQNVVVKNCYFDGNNRNGLTLGSGFKHITISNNYFGPNIVGSPIDSEPHHGICSNVLIEKNEFDGKATGTIITLGGHITVDGYIIRNNNFKNVGIFIIRSKNVKVTGNQFDMKKCSRPLFTITYACDNIEISDNKISTDVKLIYFTATRGGFPKNITFSNNEIRSTYSLNEMSLIQGVSRLNMTGNSFIIVSDSKFPVIKLKANRAMSSVKISDNKISGLKGEFVKLELSKKFRTSDFVIVDNYQGGKSLPEYSIPKE